MRSPSSCHSTGRSGSVSTDPQSETGNEVLQLLSNSLIVLCPGRLSAAPCRPCGAPAPWSCSSPPPPWARPTPTPTGRGTTPIWRSVSFRRRSVKRVVYKENTRLPDLLSSDKRLFETKRKDQLNALKNLVELNDINQQYKIIDIMLKGLFKVPSTSSSEQTEG